MPGIHDFEVGRLGGGVIRFADFAGKVLLVVNTASRCGFTPQYRGLEQLHQQLGPRGLVVVGFPCNQFGAQEPGTADEIATFCERNYGVDFLLTEKVNVNGPDAHPVFAYVTAALPGVLGSRAVKWNFTKFLVDRSGTPIRRYAPTTTPETLAADIEALL